MKLFFLSLCLIFLIANQKYANAAGTNDDPSNESPENGSYFPVAPPVYDSNSSAAPVSNSPYGNSSAAPVNNPPYGSPLDYSASSPPSPTFPNYPAPLTVDFSPLESPTDQNALALTDQNGSGSRYEYEDEFSQSGSSQMDPEKRRILNMMKDYEKVFIDDFSKKMFSDDSLRNYRRLLYLFQQHLQSLKQAGNNMLDEHVTKYGKNSEASFYFSNFIGLFLPLYNTYASSFASILIQNYETIKEQCKVTPLPKLGDSPETDQEEQKQFREIRRWNKIVEESKAHWDAYYNEIETKFRIKDVSACNEQTTTNLSRVFNCDSKIDKKLVRSLLNEITSIWERVLNIRMPRVSGQSTPPNSWPNFAPAFGGNPDSDARSIRSTGSKKSGSRFSLFGRKSKSSDDLASSDNGDNGDYATFVRDAKADEKANKKGGLFRRKSKKVNPDDDDTASVSTASTRSSLGSIFRLGKRS